ncbi:hypothetical protein BH20VER3_BH20VER3_00960 [soil metagenome]
MKTYVDLELEKLVIAPGTGQFVEELKFKRALTAQVPVQFSRKGVAEELPADATGILGLKPLGQYDADYVVAALAWVKSGTGVGALYTFTLSFINPDLDALFRVDGDPENDVVAIELMGELQWIYGGTTYKSQTFVVTIVNDVNRGGETVPDLPPLAFGVYLPSITGLTGGASSDLDAVPTVTLRTGYIVQVLRVNGEGDYEWLAFVLTTGSASLSSDVQPLDHDGATNDRYWRGAAAGIVENSGISVLSVAFVADGDVDVFQLVTVTGEPADSENLSHRGRVLGVALEATLDGFAGRAAIDGEIVNPAWSWSPGQKVWLNGTALSASPPITGFSQQVAVAKSATTLVVQLEPPVLL